MLACTAAAALEAAATVSLHLAGAFPGGSAREFIAHEFVRAIANDKIFEFPYGPQN